MTHTFIVSTPNSLLRPLSWQGIQAQSAYDQLAHTLRMRLGENHAAILAEPVSDAEAEGIDWYATTPGTPVKLALLPPGEQEQVKGKLQEFAQKTKELASSLKQSNDSNSVLAGSLLELALLYPSEEYLYALKSDEGELSPLLAGWGFALAGLASEPEDITAIKAMAVSDPGSLPAHEQDSAQPLPGGQASHEGSAPAASPFFAGGGKNEHSAQSPQNADATVIRHVFPFPWSLFAFLLAAAIMIFLLLWLLPRLGLPETFGFAGCSRQEPAALPESGFDPAELYRAQGREDALRAELERLRKEYETRLWLCDKQAQAEPAPEPPAAEPETDPVPSVPKLALPELPPDPPPKPKPETKPQPKPEAKPQPKPETKPQPDVMVIPENPSNLEFLEGCWYAQTGLKSTRTKMPISVKYCFDKNGNGSITLIERDKKGRELQRCRGGARATLSGGQLYINDLGAVCPNGGRYEKERITCRNADSSQALCTGVGNPSGRKNWWNKPFTRTDR